MAAAFEVVPSREARMALSAVLARFRKGDRTPMVFGSHRRAEAVVVPYEEWVRMTAVREQVEADQRLAAIVQERLDDPRPSVVVDLDSMSEFLAREVGPVAAEVWDQLGADGQ